MLTDSCVLHRHEQVNVGRSATRWTVHFRRTAGGGWTREARDREWRRKMKDNGCR